MNWRLILGLSTFGLVMGVASVFFLPPAAEPACWLGVFVLCAAVIARHRVERPFAHGFLTSLANSFWITSTHVLFYDRFIAGHPREAAFAAGLSTPRLTMLATGPIIGAGMGLILGAMACGACRVTCGSSATRSAPTS
jgi:hypothetical protein